MPVTQAAMIAAASFGLRRSGTFATATSGAAYWAASVRHGPPWPLPTDTRHHLISFVPDFVRAVRTACPRGFSYFASAIAYRAS